MNNTRKELLLLKRKELEEKISKELAAMNAVQGAYKVLMNS